MAADPRQRWNNIYADRDVGGEPSVVLTRHAALLPSPGLCLDVACGLGRNAIHLARLGFMVDAWDVSDTATGKLADYAAAERLPINTRALAIAPGDIPANTYDLVLNLNYLDRALFAPLAASLREGGVLMVCTFAAHKVVDFGPSNTDYLLQVGELPEIFSALEVLAYEDEGANPDENHPLAGRVCLVGRKG